MFENTKELSADQKSNEPWDRRQTATAGVWAGGGSIGEGADDYHNELFSRRGFIQTAKSSGVPVADMKTLRFLYNPSTVAITHGLDGQNMQLAQWQRSEDMTGTALLPVNNSCSFSLLFDRTFDVIGPRDKPPAKFGVMYDVNMLYNLCGINQKVKPNIGGGGDDDFPVGPWIGGSDKDDKPSSDSGEMPQTITGPMQMVPVDVYFGGHQNLYFYGFISNISINYSHWVQEMIPTRCAVSLTVTGLPK
ncbi:hypothetical protein [Streptomyces sp. UNOC14_S4]|uniref:hypothetical protein n=1 Tax=Streptomyces sp. UNOC14_S4 TaxID=2872340 RepID=UPI001E53FE50|nr:hypothetical protein [Streptomyces sp. UNOC14_S4]MCC3766038.1 hypothetical protein [Streptomyces sp. UNOC14_S4]